LSPHLAIRIKLRSGVELFSHERGGEAGNLVFTGGANPISWRVCKLRELTRRSRGTVFTAAKQGGTIMKKPFIFFTAILFVFFGQAQVRTLLWSAADGKESWKTALIDISPETKPLIPSRCVVNSGTMKGTEIILVEVTGAVPDTVRISVFPNPSKGYFTVRANKTSSLLLVNILGDIVQNIELNEENNFTYAFNDLANGVYFIRDDRDRVRQRIVVSK
jgi:hypothetical protein